MQIKSMFPIKHKSTLNQAKGKYIKLGKKYLNRK